MKKGFTLIELMIVISILGAMMMTGLYPGFSLLHDAEKRGGFSDYTENMINLLMKVEADLQKGDKTAVTTDSLIINRKNGGVVKYVSMDNSIPDEPPMICRSYLAEKKCFAGLSFQADAFSNHFFRIDYTLDFGSKRSFMLTEVHPYAR